MRKPYGALRLPRHHQRPGRSDDLHIPNVGSLEFTSQPNAENGFADHLCGGWIVSTLNPMKGQRLTETVLLQ